MPRASNVFVIAKVYGSPPLPGKLNSSEEMARILRAPSLVFNRAALVRYIPAAYSKHSENDPSKTWTLAVYRLIVHESGQLGARLVYYRKAGRRAGSWVTQHEA